MSQSKEIRDLFIQYKASKLSLQMAFPNVQVEDLDKIAACVCMENVPVAIRRAPEPPVQEQVLPRRRRLSLSPQGHIFLHVGRGYYKVSPQVQASLYAPTGLIGRLLQVMGGWTMSKEQILNALKAKGWLPEVHDPLAHISFTLSSAKILANGKATPDPEPSPQTEEPLYFRDKIRTVIGKGVMNRAEIKDGLAEHGWTPISNDVLAYITNTLLTSMDKDGNPIFEKDAKGRGYYRVSRASLSADAPPVATPATTTTLRDKFIKVIGKRSMNKQQIHDALEARGWLPENSKDILPYIAHELCAMKWANGERVFIRDDRDASSESLPPTPTTSRTFWPTTRSSTSGLRKGRTA